MERIMATMEISVKKYVVRLSSEERERLEALIGKGKSPAGRVLKARILLKADVSDAGPGWHPEVSPSVRASDVASTAPTLWQSNGELFEFTTCDAWIRISPWA